MRTVLAALDASAAARPVLEAAGGIARLMGATVAAVHVREDSVELPEWLSSRHDVPAARRRRAGPGHPAGRGGGAGHDRRRVRCPGRPA